MSLTSVHSVLLVLLGLTFLVGGAWFGVVSIRERERRAALLAFAAAGAGSLPFFVVTVLPRSIGFAVLTGVAIAGLAAVVVGVLPIGSSVVENGRPAHRVDERDIMFARARLEPGSPEFEAYYAMRPGKRRNDDRTRSLPGLLARDSPLADPVVFAAAKASFDVCAALRDEVDGRVASTRRGRPAAEMTGVVKRLTLHLGARDVGVTALRPYHVYTHVGRGSGAWGDPITLDHRWAIAFTVEMDHASMRRAPAAPVVAESARQYVESARIAIQIATWIRRLGYPARAHIDGNYRVIAPLVAQDAGLGEIGRIGILMTPRLGPRVRLGVVTTDLPLTPDEPGDDTSVLDFCTVCKKCAENCPSRSISFEDRTPVDGGGRRWALDADSCFRYWNAVGTDCGVCMTVCPYSHPDNAAHNLARWAIRRSGTARRAALWLDDVFYGRRLRSATRPARLRSRERDDWL
jgi:reductive dehalogenase